MIRYGIVHEISGGLYTFARGNQGRVHYDTKEEAQKALELFRPGLESKLNLKGLRVFAIDCWDHGDSKSSVFGGETSLPENQYLMDVIHELETNPPKFADDPGGYYAKKRYDAELALKYVELTKRIYGEDAEHYKKAVKRHEAALYVGD